MTIDPIAETPHAYIYYSGDMVEHVTIEEGYGLQAYLQILEKDCESLSSLIDCSELPTEAFERASRPDQPWELVLTGVQVPQIGVIDWISRYPPSSVSHWPKHLVLTKLIKKLTRCLKRLSSGGVSFQEGSSARQCLPRSLPGMRVPMRPPCLQTVSNQGGYAADNLSMDVISASALKENVDGLSEWPRISVVTVSYNHSRFLRECLESVLSQNYPNLEFIVIDGGSTDGSCEILHTYQPRLSHLVIEADRGQSDALNKGFQLATGEVLTWLCSDDCLEPGALKAVARIRLTQKCDIIVGGCRVIDGSGQTRLVHYSGFNRNCLSPLSFGDLASFTSTWQKGLYFYQPELFFTRDLWIRAGSHVKENLYYTMDYELYLRFALCSARLYAINEVLASSRQHADQKTKHDLPMYLPTVKRILTDFHHKLRHLEQI